MRLTYSKNFPSKKLKLKCTQVFFFVASRLDFLKQLGSRGAIRDIWHLWQVKSLGKKTSEMGFGLLLT